MTSNQRRPGFRLPWSSDDEAAQSAASQSDANGTVPPEGADAPLAAVAAASKDSELEAPATRSPQPTPTDAAMTPTPTPSPSPATHEPPTDTKPAAVAEAAAPPVTETSAGFMRDLVAAMRRVAEETRQAGLADLRAKSEEQVRELEADSERVREELRSRAEADIAGVGAWASSEEERIKREAEQKVVGRRAQLDQQLAAEATRAEAEAQALRDRVAAYEGELDAYHAQLSDIAARAAFAAAAKRMPSPPHLAGTSAPSETAAPEEPAAPVAKGPEPAVAEAASEPADDAATTPAIHPAEEEVLTARLAELDATLEGGHHPADAPAGAGPQPGESAATEVLVKGLGSFGAITGFRQSLAAVEGIDGVSLSLGPTGEFVFRAIHAAGFDVSAAIIGLEGESATVEERPEGGLRVTLDRAR